MYKTILILTLVCFLSTLYQPRVTTLRARKYIPLKNEYRQLRISPLPMKGNKIDVTSIIIDSSFVRQEDLSGLSANQKRMLGTVAAAIKANNFQKARVDWNSLITQFRNQPTPINMSGVIGSVSGSVISDPAADSTTNSAKIQAIASEIKYLLGELKLLHDFLISLNAQLKGLKANAPAPGNFDKVEEYNMAMADFNNLMNDLQAKIQKRQQEIAQIERRIQELLKELEKLMNKEEGLKLQQLVKRISTMLHNEAVRLIKK